MAGQQATTHFVPYDAPADISAHLGSWPATWTASTCGPRSAWSSIRPAGVAPGSRADIWLDTSRIHLFDPRTGENLTRVGSSAVAG